jgi:lysophospholipase L1-like esterase
VVERFADTCRAADVPVLVAVFPAFWSYDDFAQYPWSAVHTQVVQAFEARGLPAFDLVPYFAAAGLTAASAKVDDEHPNARGHAVAAQAIAEQLRQRGL